MGGGLLTAESRQLRAALRISPSMPDSINLRRVAVCIVIAALILLIPTAADFTANVRVTAAIGLLMALLWLTEAVPMGLTALLPLILFPLAGVSTTEKIAVPYANPAVFL